MAQRAQKRLDKAEYDGRQYGVDYDDYFAVIVGATSGGAPYGITWEEWNRDNSEDFEII
jgi:hypothetical protein